MKKNLGAILILVGLFFAIVAINFIFMADESGEQENEQTGSRSSYRATPFGTLGFYELLTESGYQVTRFTEPLTSLSARRDITTLVIISPPAFFGPSEEEFQSLNAWIETGGWLIVIDRDIHATFGNAEASTHRANSQTEVKRLQPTLYTRGIEKLELSPFANRVKLKSAPFTNHVGDDQGAVLADARVGRGRVVLLTDPFVVANNGIARRDNAILAINLFADSERPAGIIAFDEYHHGFGSSRSEGIMAYFSGTPVPWMMAQLGLIALFLVYTYGRRFARPLPLKQERRTTNLEFVSSMANITRLARASDLAMKNIYGEFHKRLCRYAGLSPTANAERLAAVTARRSRLREDELRGLLSRCERVAGGAKVSDAELLNLVRRIRDIEAELKL
ncbi:MAG: DUF4350 domain-containing protein [Acidobacteriota bacterium]